MPLHAPLRPAAPRCAPSNRLSSLEFASVMPPFITELGDNPTSPQLPALGMETVWILFTVPLHFSPHMLPRGGLFPRFKVGKLRHGEPPDQLHSAGDGVILGIGLRRCKD